MLLAKIILILCFLCSLQPSIIYGQNQSIENAKEKADSLYTHGDFSASSKTFKNISNYYQKGNIDSFEIYYFLYLKSLARFGQANTLVLIDDFLINQVKNPNIRLKAMLEKGNILTNKFMTDEAIKHNYEMLSYYKKHEISDFILLSNIYKQLSFNYMISGKADSTEHYSYLNLAHIKSVYQETNIEFGYAYYTLGNFYADYENVEKADSFYYLAKINLESNLDENHPNLAQLYYVYSHVRLDLGHYDEARELCFKAIKIFEEKGMKVDMGYAYTNLSLIESRTNNLENYKLYLDKINEIYSEVEVYPSLAIANMNDGFSAYEIGQNEDYQKAIAYQKKSLKERKDAVGDDSYEILQSYYNLALSYGRIDSLDSTKYYIKRCLSIFENENIDSTLSYWNVNFEQATLLQKQHKYTAAIELMKQVANGYAQLLGSNHLYVLECYRIIYECYQSLEDKSNYKKYLFMSTAPYFEEDLSGVKINYDILDAVHKRIELILKEASSKQAYLDVFKTTEKLNLGSSIQRSMITDRRDLIEYNKVLININHLLIDNAITAYKKYMDPVFGDKIFTLINEKWSNLIKSKISEDNLLALSKISDSEKEKYKVLRSEARYLELVTASDEAYQPKDLKERKIALKKDLNEWNLKNKDLLEQPKNEKNKSFVNLKNALKASKTNLLSYDIVDGVYQCLLIKGDSIDFITLHKTITIDSLLNTFFKLLQDRENVSEISDLAYKLYQSLLKPLGTLDENLYIIPTGNLKRLNFETLAFSNKGKDKNKEVDWLINHYEITYGINIPDLTKNKKDNAADNMLVIAPGFKTNINNAKSNSLSFNLSSTPWTLAFCKQLSKNYNGLLLTEEEASKENWEKHKNGQDIIHIGTHAVTDDSNPLNSKLLLDNNGNGISFFDIYKSDLNSKLIVLAGCETGIGQLSETKEQLSLAHAFQYAGSDNLIQSMWKIDDESTNIILEDFYKNYMISNNTGQSLRQAKIKFINEASETFASPYFWGGLVYMGNEIESQPSFINYKYLFGLISIGLLSYLLYRVIPKKKK